MHIDLQVANHLVIYSKEIEMLKKFKHLINLIKSIEERFNKLDLAIGKIETRLNDSLVSENLNDYEFKVSSQWGEDGIIQFLVKNILIENKIFVEFGVEKYTESNTRFLLQNNDWQGLLIDGSKENICYIKNDPIYWKHNLKAEHAFLTKENVNQTISNNGIQGDIGILSIDVDGNDYWIWEEINCITPRIVICEFNALFGNKERVSVPYKPNFVWTDEHFSNLYWGASLAALEFLGKQKGYSLIGVNSAGNNAFFIRDDLAHNLNKTTAHEVHKYSSFRQSRNERGELTCLDANEGLSLISNCIIERVDTSQRFTVHQLFGKADEV